MNKSSKEFDPDRLVLSKKEILEFCDKVLEKWKKEPKNNARNIVAMTAVRTSVFWTDEESLKAIWGEIMNWTFELMYKNAIAQAKEEKAEWSPVLGKIANTNNPTQFETGIWY